MEKKLNKNGKKLNGNGLEMRGKSNGNEMNRVDGNKTINVKL